MVRAASKLAGWGHVRRISAAFTPAVSLYACVRACAMSTNAHTTQITGGRHVYCARKPITSTHPDELSQASAAYMITNGTRHTRPYTHTYIHTHEHTHSHARSQFTRAGDITLKCDDVERTRVCVCVCECVRVHDACWCSIYPFEQIADPTRFANACSRIRYRRFWGTHALHDFRLTRFARFGGGL